jgi:predicted phage terminase large subunit-like protein
MTPEEGIMKIAQRCRYDLYFLCKYVLGYELMEEEVHGDLCHYVEHLLPSHKEDYVPPDTLEGAGLEDNFNPKNNNLLLLLPRGTFKSSVVTIGFTLQIALNEPNMRVLIDSETQSKAKAFLSEIKGHLEKGDMYRACFKAIHGVYPDGVSTKRNKDLLWTNAEVVLASRSKPLKEPSIMVSGIDKSINGMHYDYIICDDLHSEKNVTNAEQIEQVKAHWKLNYSLLDPGKVMIVIGTRWHFVDLYQEILDNHREDYNVIIRRAIKVNGEAFFPQRLPLEELEKIKQKQGSGHFCNPGYAPILMADWSTKPLEEVKVGDEVIGFVKGDGQRNPGQTHNKLVKTKVTAISKDLRRVQTVYMESGRGLTCTPDHNWYTGRQDKTHKPYLPAQVGRNLIEIINTSDKSTEENIARWNYLAGIMDADGACKHGSISIAQYKLSNEAVYGRIQETLDKLNVPYRAYDKSFTLNGGRQTKFDILRYANPAKAEQIRKTMWSKHGRIGARKDKVVSIEDGGFEMVYGLTTGTGNYVAWGYASQNSNQYMNEPISSDDAIFKRENMVRREWDIVKNRPINWYLMVDPSFEGPYSDFAGLIVAGMDYQRDLYVRHVLRKKMNYSQIIEAIFDLNHRYQPKTIGIKIVSSAKSLMYELDNEQKRRGVWLPVRELRDNKHSKEERIKGLAPFYEFGHAFHIKDCPQLLDLEDEMLKFPVGQHDDVLDAYASLLELATPPNSHAVTEEKREKHRTKFKPRSYITGT